MLRTASVSILPWLRCAGKNGMPACHARRGLRPSGAAVLRRRATRRVKAPGKPGTVPSAPWGPERSVVEGPSVRFPSPGGVCIPPGSAVLSAASLTHKPPRGGALGGPAFGGVWISSRTGGEGPEGALHYRCSNTAL